MHSPITTRTVRRTINWVAAFGCLVAAIVYTVEDKPVEKIAILALLGLANLAFILAR